MKLQKIDELFRVASRAEIDNVLGKRELAQPRWLNPRVGLDKPELHFSIRIRQGAHRARELVPGEEDRVGDALAEGVEVDELDPILGRPCTNDVCTLGEGAGTSKSDIVRKVV